MPEKVTTAKKMLRTPVNLQHLLVYFYRYGSTTRTSLYLKLHASYLKRTLNLSQSFLISTILLDVPVRDSFVKCRHTKSSLPQRVLRQRRWWTYWNHPFLFDTEPLLRFFKRGRCWPSTTCRSMSWPRWGDHSNSKFGDKPRSKARFASDAAAGLKRAARI